MQMDLSTWYQPYSHPQILRLCHGPVTGLLLFLQDHAFQQLVSTLTGQIATSLAALAVIACGFMAWAGRLTWGYAGSIIFGIVLVFGASQIVSFFQSAVGTG